MKVLLSIVLGLSTFFSTSIYAGVNINHVVAQFRQANPQFKGFQLPLKSENPPYAIGDANKDKIDDVMFYITPTKNPKSTPYLVIMKGLGNNKFKTLVINNNILDTSWAILNIMDNSYSITHLAGGYVTSGDAAQFWIVELEPTLNNQLVINEVSYSSYWESESGIPANGYLYNFKKKYYSESWRDMDYIPEIKDSGWVSKTDEGKFILKNGQKYLYFTSTTNPFKSSTDFKSDYVLNNIIKKRRK